MNIEEAKMKSLCSSVHRVNKNKTGLLHLSYVTPVGCQQFRKRSRKRRTGIMFERYYSFLHRCLLSCGYLKFQKIILSIPK